MISEWFIKILSVSFNEISTDAGAFNRREAVARCGFGKLLCLRYAQDLKEQGHRYNTFEEITYQEWSCRQADQVLRFITALAQLKIIYTFFFLAASTSGNK
jgi:hypothetical protein